MIIIKVVCLILAALLVVGVALKVSVEIGETVLLVELKEDWSYRFPYHVRNNRYRGASRALYPFWVFVYYLIKSFFLLCLCFLCYILAGVIFGGKWTWEKI